MTNGYNFDALNNILTVSSSFLKKASRVGSPEYYIVLKLRKEVPELTIREAEKREAKKGITYAKMRIFIEGDRNAKALIAEFEKVRKLSRVQSMPYRYVRTWFENKFPYYSEQPVLDADNFVIDPANPANEAATLREVAIGTMERKASAEVVPAEGKVA